MRVCSDVGASFDLAHGGVLGQSGAPTLAAYEACEASPLRDPKFIELVFKYSDDSAAGTTHDETWNSLQRRIGRR